MTITWKEFKELIDNSPDVKDDTPIWYIDVTYPTKEILIAITDTGELFVRD